MTAHKPRKWTEEQQEAQIQCIVELRDAGKSCAECAADLDLSLYQIANLIRMFKLQHRWPRGRHRNAKWIDAPSLTKKHKVPPISLGEFAMRIRGMGGREREFIHILPHTERQFDAIVEHLVECGGEVL